jgi:ribosomal protein S18 acetylase RimI-like enzyme
VTAMAAAVESCDPFTRLEEIFEVYVLAQAGITDEPRARLWRDEYLPRHATRADFDFLVATLDGRVAGFGYGYTGDYGQWWTDRIAAAMTPEVRAAWVDPPHFEVVELHVRPSAQRRGVGTRLLGELLARQPHDRALLTTHAHDRPGLPFYTRLGWQRLADVRFDPRGSVMAVMGLDRLGT